MIVRFAMEAEPVLVGPDMSIHDALTEFFEHGHENAAVVSGPDAVFIGVLSLHDILRKTVPVYNYMGFNLMKIVHDGYFDEHFNAVANLSVRDLMTTKVHAVHPHATVISAVAQMVEHRYISIPVVEDGHFIGMLTRTSILRAVMDSQKSR